MSLGVIERIERRISATRSNRELLKSMVVSETTLSVQFTSLTNSVFIIKDSNVSGSGLYPREMTRVELVG